MTPPEGQRTIVMGVSLPLLDTARPADSPKPPWLKVRAPGGPKYIRLKGLMREWNLHSVCEEAHCPNIGECWEDLTATFMILGDVCTSVNRDDLADGGAAAFAATVRAIRRSAHDCRVELLIPDFQGSAAALD